MTKELAEFLVKAAEHCGTEGVTIRPDYSGRGMFGKTTYAIVVPGNGMELLLNAIQFINETLEDMTADQLAESTFIPYVANMGSLRTNNMGRDSIVIY